MSFLKLLFEYDVQFLIIGGQARVRYYGGTTSDLDLWLPAETSPASPVHRALKNWSARYPIHTRHRITGDISLSETTQVQFPECEVCVLTDSLTVEKVTHETKIDLLFGFAAISFKDAYQEKVMFEQDGLNLPLVSKEYLEKTGGLRKVGNPA